MGSFGYGEILNFQNLFIAIENFEARAVPLHSISVTPRKLCLAPKVLLGGLRDRTVQYATFGYGEILNFQNLFIAIENFEATPVPLHSISVTPRKLGLAPKVLLGGLRDRTVQYATLVWGITKFSYFFSWNKEFRSRGCSAVLISRNPRKAMFGPESASWGVTGSCS